MNWLLKEWTWWRIFPLFRPIPAKIRGTSHSRTMERSSERITLKHTRTAVIEREQKKCAIRMRNRDGTVYQNPVNCTLIVFFFRSKYNVQQFGFSWKRVQNIQELYKNSFDVILVLFLVANGGEWDGGKIKIRFTLECNWKKFYWIYL